MSALGNDPMPWQRDALAIACEIDPATGGFYYDTVIIVVLRRAGKTTISRGKTKHRALTTQDAIMVYTAQNRLKALARLRKDFYKPFQRSPFANAMAKPRWRGGEEALQWKNGAELAIDAVGKNSGHGDTLHEAHIDEAYAHVDSTLEGGVAPALMTVIGSQLWILSAAGNSNSTYLRGKVDLGRALVESKLPSRTCYIEYSADLNADPNDPETLRNTHPAVGYTLDAERIMSQRVAKDEDSLREWERAWYGWWPVAKAPPRVIPTAGWESNYVAGGDAETWTGKPFWAIDTSPDRDYSSIAMAAKSTDPRARCYVELYDTLLGTAGVVNQMVSLRSEFGGNIIAMDGNGAAKSLKKDLEDEGFEVILVPGPSRVDACGGFHDDALIGSLRFENDSELNKSMGHAVKQSVGGAAYIWGRGKSLGDISGFYAVTFARWLFREKAGDVYDPLDTILGGRQQ
ncbi:hypothetical protein V1638_04185 [Pseudarthrobacter sp. J64]|uniref:hypothetical protein n=1 Tax=Pseudarthrobacter sp. J64 TaxID=3116485 RepID=UPI002E81AE7A|nr:hypothetical protein [Pseudarthrobacter sp. J64]MEE2568595.1 hypothetical protein [Pseudarthrobacter sp. J64]